MDDDRWGQIGIGLCGLLCIAGGLFGWGFFLNNWKARPIVNLLGERGTRIFHVLLGAGLVAFALLGDFSGSAG